MKTDSKIPEHGFKGHAPVERPRSGSLHNTPPAPVFDRATVPVRGFIPAEIAAAFSFACQPLIIVNNILNRVFASRECFTPAGIMTDSPFFNCNG